MASGASLCCRALLLGRLVALAASSAGVVNTSADLNASVVNISVDTSVNISVVNISVKTSAGVVNISVNTSVVNTSVDSDASMTEEASALNSTGAGAEFVELNTSAVNNAGVVKTSVVNNAGVVNTSVKTSVGSGSSRKEEASALNSTFAERSELNLTAAEASALNSTGAEISALNSTEADVLVLGSSEASSEPRSMADRGIGELHSTTGEAESGMGESSVRAVNHSEAEAGQLTWGALLKHAEEALASSEPSTTADQGVGDLYSTTEEAGAGVEEAPPAIVWFAFTTDPWRWALAAALLCVAAPMCAAGLWTAVRARRHTTRAAELQRLPSLDLEEGQSDGDAHFSDGMKRALVAAAAEPVAVEPIGARAAPLPVLLTPAARPPQGFFKRAAAPTPAHAAAPAPAYVPLAWSGTTAVASPLWVAATPPPPLSPQPLASAAGLPGATAPRARAPARAQPAGQFGAEPVAAQRPFV